MKAHLANAAYGVLDYAAHPALMLLAAPLLLHHLGVAGYGVWVIATAAITTGAIIASGFGDANIQHVAIARSRGDIVSLQHTVRSMMGINLLLGGFMALLAWVLSPLLARHVVSGDHGLQIACLWSLRIAGVLMLLRAMESVCISTQRAFERYGAAVRVSILARILTLLTAIALASQGFGLIAIMLATAALLAAGIVVQFLRLRRLLERASLLPAFDNGATKALFNFGLFSWLLAVAGVVFNQADRLILGVSLGATAVTAYALCIQMAQPIYGIASAALHFLFPYLSHRRAAASRTALRNSIVMALAANLLLVALGTSTVLFAGVPLLHAWVGAAIAQSASVILTPVVWSFALLGAGVTAYYAMLALGEVRTITWLNLLGGAATLASMAWLLPGFAVRGVAVARLCYGVITLFAYVPLARHLRGPATDASAAVLGAVCEDA